MVNAFIADYGRTDLANHYILDRVTMLMPELPTIPAYLDCFFILANRL